MNEKHLEFIQNNITRMNRCSFQMKGWTITLTSALIALFVSTISENNSGNKIYIYASIISTFLFWCLDSLYLSKERKFIGIYNDGMFMIAYTLSLRRTKTPVCLISLPAPAQQDTP